MSENERALKPEYLTRLFVQRANAGDAKGVAEPYEEQAVMAHPPGSQMVGRDAIRGLWAKVLANAPQLRTGATVADPDQRRCRTYLHRAQGWRGRSRAGGSQATGRLLASSARLARVRANSPGDENAARNTVKRTRADPQPSTADASPD
jgi:ketosteroid isomerase-like protein